MAEYRFYFDYRLKTGLLVPIVILFRVPYSNGTNGNRIYTLLLLWLLLVVRSHVRLSVYLSALFIQKNSTRALRVKPCRGRLHKLTINVHNQHPNSEQFLKNHTNSCPVWELNPRRATQCKLASNNHPFKITWKDTLLTL